MKTKILSILLISILSLFITGCEREPEMCISFAEFSFKQTYLRHFQNDDVFLIKGVASDVNKHGRKIEVIKDLKGNFDGQSNIFVWGATGIMCGTLERVDARFDFITQYNKNDTLIMFIDRVHRRFRGDIERSSDYTTLNSYSSVIKLSNGFVSGFVNYWNVPVRWNDLQNELQARLSMPEMLPSWLGTDGLIPDPFIIAYKGIEKFKGMYHPQLGDIYNSYFFVKGLVLDSHQEYGKRVRLIDDLKGNFPEGITDFTVWGNRGFPWRLRFDDLTLFNQQDTLIMLLQQVGRTEEIISDNIERIGDYVTIPYSFSTLKFSNNSVHGHITSTYREKETMSWEIFSDLIK